MYSPRRGSTIFSVINATRTVSSSTDATENQKFAVNSIERDGSRMWIASFVMPVRMPSSGLIRMFTLKTAATPANDAARPASGCLPRLRNAAAASGISTR